MYDEIELLILIIEIVTKIEPLFHNQNIVRESVTPPTLQ